MINDQIKLGIISARKLVLMGIAAFAMVSAAEGSEAIMRQKCLACHGATESATAPFTRISQQRKTPEGWQMTLSRMQQRHGLSISPDEVRSVVRYLSDTQGLAPSETQGMRYVLEQQPNVVEQIDPVYVEMCARCHSAARFGLQRRSTDEWRELVNTHMALHPTAELHALSRDRAWYQIALQETVPSLATDYAFDARAWKQWKNASKPELAGYWSAVGFLPTKGSYSAVIEVLARADGDFQLSLQGHYADGRAMHGSGVATVYGGYEWRATLSLDGIKMRQVMAASEDGKSLSGRMFELAHDEIGGELVAVSGNAIAGVFPSAIKQGETKLLTIVGRQLKGPVRLGAGIRVKEVKVRGDDRVVVLAQAVGGAELGPRRVEVGDSSAVTSLIVYDTVARVEVIPAESIARIGDNGGRLAKVKSSYRALGFSAGPDGEAGTDDDLHLGFLPAQWSLQPFDEVAEHDKDLKYAGTIDRAGIFTPGDAGLNPERRMSTNNVGNLKVVAQVGVGQEQVRGEGHLLVTVPSFIKRAIQ